MYKSGVFHVQIGSFFIDIISDLLYNTNHVQIRSFLNQSKKRKGEKQDFGNIVLLLPVWKIPKILYYAKNAKILRKAIS